ncbi:hypothetical protein C8Q76DRAFT_492102 [Earliella scabrosa]|nr:hypothetical protein C8Q76DRAFT_492102 [Earliella scabrosa]
MDSDPASSFFQALCPRSSTSGSARHEPSHGHLSPFSVTSPRSCSPFIPTTSACAGIHGAPIDASLLSQPRTSLSALLWAPCTQFLLHGNRQTASNSGVRTPHRLALRHTRGAHPAPGIHGSVGRDPAAWLDTYYLGLVSLMDAPALRSPVPRRVSRGLAFTASNTCAHCIEYTRTPWCAEHERYLPLGMRVRHPYRETPVLSDCLSYCFSALLPSSVVAVGTSMCTVASMILMS